MFSKITSTAAAASLALISVSAMALDSTRHEIKLAATVPSSSFAIFPILAATESDTHQLAFNGVTGAFSSFSAQYNVKSSSAVKASLATTVSNKLYHTNGADTIDLEVKFNNKVLSTTAAEVVDATSALVQATYPLLITPGAAQVAGTYSGTVSLVFESTL